MVREKCKDPYGNEYNNQGEMASAYGVKCSTFKKRKSTGWTLKECLGIDIHNGVIAPSGQEFKSEVDMAKSYGVDYDMYCNRKHIGWTLEECLGVKKRNAVIDPLGEEFESEAEMARHWGVSVEQFRSRMGIGWTLRECLGLDTRNAKHIKDKYGNEFTSERAMAMHYKVDYSLYLSRKKAGWTQMETLGLDKHMNKKDALICVDERSFETAKELADYYGIDYYVYSARKSNGWGQMECLGLEGRGLDARLQSGEVINKRLVVERWATNRFSQSNSVDNRFYYKVRVSATDEIKYMNSDQIKSYPEGWKTLLDDGNSDAINEDELGIWYYTRLTRNGLKREYSEECKIE